MVILSEQKSEAASSRKLQTAELSFLFFDGFAGFVFTLFRRYWDLTSGSAGR